MKIVCTCVCMILAACVLYGQDRPIQMIPQTPNAYSLGKFGDIPVSLYTGVPNISVPIYTMKNHDASVAVSLNYHGPGIKVDEIASFVGLGWSLDAGGVITRVVRGKPETLLSDGSLFPQRSDIQFYDYVQHPSKTDFIYGNKLYFAATGQLDNEPDLFYFNIMGRAGKFVFDKDGKAVLETNEGLDIRWQYVPGYELQKIIVRDEKGTVYEFKDYEETFYPQKGINRISAWYLSKITSASGSVIDFEYYAASSSNLLTRSYTTSIVDVLPYNTSVTPPIYVPYEGTGFSELRLHKIKSESGEIEFIYKTERRKDYALLPITNPASSALDEIRIYKPDARLLKKFKLSTGYFQSNDAEKYSGLEPEIYSYLNYRLRLAQYLDGLGRALQIVNRQATPGTIPKDIVTPFVYDQNGLEMYKYQPYVAQGSQNSNGTFKANPFSDQDKFYRTAYKDANRMLMYAGEQFLYTQTAFEASPLHRVS